METVSTVRLVDGIPVLYVVRDRQLTIVALDPSTGRELWSAPSTLSDQVPGIGMTVGVADDAVVYLSPTERDAFPGMAVVQARDAQTGQELAGRSEPSYFLEAPDGCPDDETATCAKVSDGSQESYLRMGGSSQEPPDEGADADPGIEDWSQIGPLGLSRREGHELGRVVDGRLLWQLDLSVEISPASTTDTGWTFEVDPAEKVIFGSVGIDPYPLPATHTTDMTEMAAFGLDADTGELLWKQQGVDLFCDGSFDDTSWIPDTPSALAPLACGWHSGVVTIVDEPSTATWRDTDLDLRRLDPRTGDPLWQVPLPADDPTLFSFRQLAVSPAGPQSVLVGTGRSAVVIDLEDGGWRPVTAGDARWVDEIVEVAIDAPSIAPGRGDSVFRVGVVQPTDSSGQAAAEVPWPIPPEIGAEAESGERFVAQPDGVVAYGAP